MLNKKPTNILIRADASARIGLGHIMRDLVLAERYDNVHFACYENPITLPYPLHKLQSNDIAELIALIHTLHVDMLIIDHYGIGYEEERAIKAQTGVTLMVLDDTYERHECDLLLNHNICADASRYKGLVPPHCIVQCGSDYTLLREEFWKEKEILRTRSGMLIALGGSDVLNLMPQMLPLLPKGLHVTLVTSSANAHLSTLKRLVSTREATELIVDATDMAKRLHTCALAIVSASTLAQEALFLNTPLLAIQTASNQHEMATYLETQGHRVLRTFDPEHFVKALHEF
jgi:UDP-2,4-diacetamido-2,4,6-trideoxy-beta-L-altropyranose hydrolase